MKQLTNKDVNIAPQLDKACGLDMHKEKIVCFISSKDGSEQELMEFGTFTCELHKLKDWLQSNRVEHCLMESTGIYWKSPYAALEAAGIRALVVNARHVKNVPGRKTDVGDAQWLATLARAGLLRGSFIPPAMMRELRQISRQRQKLVGQLASEKN